jgi:hypothetical protein
MVPFLYRCPFIGLLVQALHRHDPSDDDADWYEAVTCIACQQVHLVNPKTGKTLGVYEE